MKQYGILVAFIILVQSCATAMTPIQSPLYHADNLFRARKYEAALAAYRDILGTNRDPAVDADAQFSIAYTLIYYDNPALNYTKAMDEFGKFLLSYPHDSRYDEAQSWFMLLRALSETRRENTILNKKIEQLKQLDIRRERSLR